jgi:peptidoglycan/xylan/chitin deacetylase (PgdA/CDA1 family)
MPWKQGYTISDERSLADSEIRWPDGARCCVAVTVDLSVASGAEGVTAADLATPEALFGANQGLAALREVLRRHAMRATFAAPAIIAHIHRDLVRSLTAEGHEIAAHGFRHEDVSGLERDEERQRIARTTEILADVTGRKPAGWFSLPRQGDRYAVGAVSPNTVDLLLEAGYLYLGNGLADDIPHYWVSDFASRRALLLSRDPRRSPGAATKSSEIAPPQRRDQPVEWPQRATIVPTLPFNLPTASSYCLNAYPQR